ncbi:MAG: hypothetical protein LPK85_00180, partial [Gammaproteobacteria bacterium]|nr:hypothetical protein [Gammaproteobacteria bacterium]
MVATGEPTVFTVQPNPGFGIASVSGCAGTLSGNLYTVTAVSESCAIAVQFAPAFTVSAQLGAGGLATPATQTVLQGSVAELTVTPESGYVLDTINGCGGTLNGSTFTTEPVTADCTVTAAFAAVRTVSAVAGSGGSLSPVSQTLRQGTSASLTVTPNEGFIIDQVSGCDGTLEGNTFTTAALAENCTVTASFRGTDGNGTPLIRVTGIAGTGGSLTPTTQMLETGARAALTVTPSAAYTLSTISGCGGVLAGTTYTTAPLTADCVITASFDETRNVSIT